MAFDESGSTVDDAGAAWQQQQYRKPLSLLIYETLFTINGRTQHTPHIVYLFENSPSIGWMGG